MVWYEIEQDLKMRRTKKPLTIILQLLKTLGDHAEMRCI